MPCRCDYLEANSREIESKRVATLLTYVLPKVGQQVTNDIKAAATNYYGDLQRVDQHTALLCHTIEAMTQDQQTEIVYDGREPVARALADWWDVHQEHDRIRESQLEENRKQYEHQKLFDRLGKFSDAEIQAVLDTLEK